MDIVEKTKAIFDFYTLKAEPAGKRLVNLLNILIEEVREENDIASPDQVLKNQGKIAAFFQLKDYLEKENPTIREMIKEKP